MTSLWTLRGGGNRRRSLTLSPQVFALSVFGFTPAVEAASLQGETSPVTHLLYRGLGFRTQKIAHLVFLTCVAIHLVHIGRALQDKNKTSEALEDQPPDSEEPAGESRAHLAGVACAAFLNVTVIHRISAHNSQEFHLQ